MRMPVANARVAVRGTLLAALSLLSSAAGAESFWPDALFGTFGYTSGAFVAIYGVGASWDLKQRPPARDESGLGIRLDTELAYWWGKGRPTPYGHVWDVSATPVFRWTFTQPAAPRLFAEGGIGVHLLSATRINNDRIFSTAFQFGEMVGVGVAFGERNQYEVRVYGQHVSNGRIKLPNWGLTYPGITFSMALP